MKREFCKKCNGLLVEENNEEGYHDECLPDELEDVDHDMDGAFASHGQDWF